MVGRAGRPGFDISGNAVIMTERTNISNLERVLKDKMKGFSLTSNFSNMLEDNLNNEIACRTVLNME